MSGFYDIEEAEMFAEEPDWITPEDEAFAEWLDAHEYDDWDFGAQFRADIDAEIKRGHQAWARHIAACADLAA